MRGRGWRVAQSLERLRTQIDEHYPIRNKVSDGTIGDAAHRSRESDHNPWVVDARGMGVVTALDITHDTRTGPDTWAMAEHLRNQRDARIKYVISHKRIFSSTTSPWTWRKYTGSNPHSSHIHISVHSNKVYYDDSREWDLAFGERLAPDDDPTAPNPDSPNLRPILRRGSTGEHVRIVQSLLVLAQIDGIFGAITEAAVRAFQRKEKLAIDGVVGPNTWAKMDEIEQVPLPFGYDQPRILSEPE